ncbi:MAG: hypothetical protein CVV49_16265 [Spirochaetae bacterium HGW-Spirochaetae-5]|nr:MAG: hypothetical protein CVV49_16265 [Spirochaetae bacterium HGW-Spirochaetae-5]
MTGKMPAFFALLITVSFYIGPVYSDDKCDDTACTITALSFELSGNVLYRLGADGKTKLYDNVAAISMDAETLYYIRIADAGWIAGIFKGTAEESEEFDLPGKYEKLYKFIGFNDVFYFLALPVIDNIDEQSNDNPIYIRFNPDQLVYQSIEGVSDFVLLDGKSVILKNGSINYNGNEVPLQIPGKLRIAELIDSRIAFISGDGGTEVIDLPAGRSIYQYNANSVPEIPDEYNVVIEFADKIIRTDNDSEPGESIYYQILVDGAEDSRTVTGSGEVVKFFHLKLDSGRYHIIKPERWELDRIKGRYARMNNIYQPAELKIYIPENRIIKIRVEYNGKDYIIDQSVLYK